MSQYVRSLVDYTQQVVENSEVWPWQYRYYHHGSLPLFQYVGSLVGYAQQVTVK